jgi:hypothetical protein
MLTPLFAAYMPRGTCQRELTLPPNSAQRRTLRHSLR